MGPTPASRQHQWWFIQHSTLSSPLHLHLRYFVFVPRLDGIPRSNLHSNSPYALLARSNPNYTCSRDLVLSRSAGLMQVLAMDDPDSARPKGNGSAIPNKRRSRNGVLYTWLEPEYAIRCHLLQWLQPHCEPRGFQGSRICEWLRPLVVSQIYLWTVTRLSHVRTMLQGRYDDETCREALPRSSRGRRPALLRCVSSGYLFRVNPDSGICSLMREPELQGFVKLKTPAEKLSYEVSEAVRSAVDRSV